MCEGERNRMKMEGSKTVDLKWEGGDVGEDSGILSSGKNSAF